MSHIALTPRPPYLLLAPWLYHRFRKVFEKYHRNSSYDDVEYWRRWKAALRAIEGRAAAGGDVSCARLLDGLYFHQISEYLLPPQQLSLAEALWDILRGLPNERDGKAVLNILDSLKSIHSPHGSVILLALRLLQMPNVSAQMILNRLLIDDDHVSKHMEGYRSSIDEELRRVFAARPDVAVDWDTLDCLVKLGSIEVLRQILRADRLISTAILAVLSTEKAKPLIAQLTPMEQLQVQHLVEARHAFNLQERDRKLAEDEQKREMLRQKEAERAANFAEIVKGVRLQSETERLQCLLSFARDSKNEDLRNSVKGIGHALHASGGLNEMRRMFEAVMATNERGRSSFLPPAPHKTRCIVAHPSGGYAAPLW